MLGYTEKEIDQMLDAIYIVLEGIPPRTAEPGLKMIVDFLEGMLAEGRI